jgi:hypothetical protein
VGAGAGILEAARSGCVDRAGGVGLLLLPDPKSQLMTTAKMIPRTPHPPREPSLEVVVVADDDGV